MAMPDRPWLALTDCGILSVATVSHACVCLCVCVEQTEANCCAGYSSLPLKTIAAGYRTGDYIPGAASNAIDPATSATVIMHETGRLEEFLSDAHTTETGDAHSVRIATSRTMTPIAGSSIHPVAPTASASQELMTSASLGRSLGIVGPKSSI
jgi:hypothetical protein